MWVLTFSLSLLGYAELTGKGLGVLILKVLDIRTVAADQQSKTKMEVYGKSMVAEPSTNVIFLSSILGRDDTTTTIASHKCDWKCQNEHVCGNMFRCKLTGLTHICDKNCNQRILYDNYSSLCRVSGQVFPLSSAEQQAVRGVRRKLEVESSSSDSCGFKRRRDAQCNPSPFERSICVVAPICSQIGDGMDMS